jgi:hypothetical protein
MTATICTECGQFKVGVLTRCTKCPGPPPESEGTDFYFSDWTTPSERLSEYGDVIKALTLTGEDSSVRRLALLRYIQKNYPDSADWEMDAAVIERADKLLEAVGAQRIHRKSVRWAKWGWVIQLALALLGGLCIKALR